MSSDPYLSGEKLWGDDFDDASIQAWFEREREGYADLGAKDGSSEDYGYHGLNELHGWRRLPDRRFRHALGIGSSFGGEFQPLVDKLDALTILEPSAALRSPHIGSLEISYADPTPSGAMPFEDGVFDLVVCLGVLHHIPNVSAVLGEIWRVTEPGGWVVIREPIISMGDWRTQRKPGITQDERGIPRRLLVEMVEGLGFEVRSEALCVFPTTQRLGRHVPAMSLSSSIGARLDHWLSSAFSWNYRYHAYSRWQKVRPTSSFLVLQRQA